MTRKNEKTEARANAIDFLRKHLKPGDKVTTTVLRVARSGMSRTIMCQALIPNGQDKKPEIADISWAVAASIEARFDDMRGGVVMGGCGMDMCFATVYGLGRVLFPDGFGIEGTGSHGHVIRPKNKEMADKAVSKGVAFRGRNGDTSGWDNDGGYALEYR